MLTSQLAAEDFAGLRAELMAAVAGCRSEAELWSLLADYATARLGVTWLLVLRRTPDAASGLNELCPEYAPAGRAAVGPFRSAAALSGLGLVAAPPLAGAGVYESLFAALPEARRGGLVYAELDARVVLVLVYGQQLPVLSRRSWLLLDGLRKEAAVTLGRLRSARPD